MPSDAPLPSWSIYAILIAQGGTYALLVWFLGRTRGKTADAFLSGGRDIGHGMINASVVATWIWAATLMISSWTGYHYGFIGPWWYALGATIPLPLMAYLGRRIKTVMPQATSYPEFIRRRFDEKNHLLHSVISTVVALWITIMIITGGAIVGHAFTGAPFWAIALLMVVIFVSYIPLAGLWASIFADTIMSLMLYVCLLILAIAVLVKIGPSEIWSGLAEVARTQPVLEPGTTEAHHSSQWDGLNWLNPSGLGFLVVNTVGNLGAVLCNQTYWSRVTGAKDPQTVFKSFMTAAICWWPIPLATGTALGVAALSQGLVVGESYSYGSTMMRFTEAEAVAPVMAFLVLGFAGLTIFILAVGSATVSTGAGELLAVTTVFVNDIFKGHINPKAEGRTLLVASRVSLVVTAAALLVIVLFFRHIGFSFSGMYQAMGITFSSAVIPVIMACFVKSTNRNGAFWATIIGSVCGMSYWISTGADLLWGVVWGNIIVLGVSALIVIPWTIIKPQPFDFSALQAASKATTSDAEYAGSLKIQERMPGAGE